VTAAARGGDRRPGAPAVRGPKIPPPPPLRPPRDWVYELQIHPGDIRRRVRYVFLRRRHLALFAAGAAAWVALVATALSLAPVVADGVARSREYRALEADRARQGERLRALVGRLDDVGGRAAELRLKVDKIYLAYGLSSDESFGQGGFPPPRRPVPRSVYANVVQQGLLLESQIGSELGVIGTFLGEVHAFEEAHDERVRTTPSACPLQGDRFVLTSPFGHRRSPFTKNLDFHAGIDFAAPQGTQVHAPADGVVVFAGRYPLQRSVGWWRYGNLVAIRHGDRFVSLYGHLDTIQVRQGQRVRQGDSLAGVGSTGWSTSPHLHYEVRLADGDRVFRPVDPRIYILDHRWRDEERLLVRARSVPEGQAFEPLPPLIGRS
jgi:murein DD-endopeptidase MepM/ murein hydrolase activator NlpD